MNKLFAGMVLVLSFGCQSNISETQNTLAKLDTSISSDINEIQPLEFPKVKSEPYELKMNIIAVKGDVYELELSMILNDGAYFVSPNAKRDFKGKFTVQLEDNEKLTPISEWIEIPLSIEEYDPHPFVNGNVNWVREDTKYTLKLKRNTTESFHVQGFIQFTIEPRCTLEKIPIIIKHSGGEMRIELFQC